MSPKFTKFISVCLKRDNADAARLCRNANQAVDQVPAVDRPVNAKVSHSRYISLTLHALIWYGAYLS